MREILIFSFCLVVALPVLAAKNADVLARVGGKEIVRADLEKYIKTLPDGVKGLPKPMIEPMALNQLINDQLLLAAAEEDKVSESDDYISRMAELKKGLMREVYLQNHIGKRVTDSAVRDEYSRFRSENSEEKEFRARHMLVKTKEQAEKLIRDLDGGADFAKLAGENNLGPEKAKGGDLGYFSAKEVVPEFAEALEKMDVGKFTKEPVQTQFGWHVIKLEAKRNRPAPKFEEVKQQMRERVERRYAQEEIDRLRSDANVEVFADNLAQMPKAKAEKEKTNPAE